MAITILILLFIIIVLIGAYKKLGKERFLDHLLTSLLLPGLLVCITYIFVDYKINQRSLKNLKLDIEITEINVTQKNENNYDVKLFFSKGDVLNAYLFRIDKDNEIDCEKIKKIDKDSNSVTFSFLPSEIRIQPVYDNSNGPYPYSPLTTIPDVEQFVLYFEDYYVNTYYKYLLIKPKFDLTNLPYYVNVYRNDEIYHINYPLTLKRDFSSLSIDIKFSNKKYIASQLKEFSSSIEDYIIDPNTKPVFFSDGNKWEFNPKVNIQYSIPTVDQLIENIAFIMKQKNY